MMVAVGLDLVQVRCCVGCGGTLYMYIQDARMDLYSLRFIYIQRIYA